MKSPARNKRTEQFLGIDLGGAKSSRTALATLDYYPREEKLFLLDIVLGIGPEGGQTGDEALLEIIAECEGTLAAIGVSAPLSLPRCFECTSAKCVSSKKCSDPGVKWAQSLKLKGSAFLPYTQRPVEQWVRADVFPRLSAHARFEVDEALGANKAPLAARIRYLRRFFPKKTALFEIWPKLTAGVLGTLFRVPGSTLANLRQLEVGEAARARFLEIVLDRCDIFVYDRDLRKLTQHLSAFDAFLIAYTSFLAKTGHSQRPPKAFDPKWGWVQFPRE